MCLVTEKISSNSDVSRVFWDTFQSIKYALFNNKIILNFLKNKTNVLEISRTIWQGLMSEGEERFEKKMKKKYLGRRRKRTIWVFLAIV